jgi:hypothetical protein
MALVLLWRMGMMSKRTQREVDGAGWEAEGKWSMSQQAAMLTT